MSDATASLEQLATEVPGKLNLLVQELPAVQEGVDGLETYLDEVGDSRHRSPT